MITNELTVTRELPESFCYNMSNNENIVTLIARKKENWEKTLDVLYPEILYIINENFKEMIPCVWVKTDNFTVMNKLQELKGLWKSDQLLWYKSEERSMSYVHHNKIGKYFSGIGQLTIQDSLFQAVDLARRKTEVVLFMANNVSEKYDEIDNFISSNYNDISKLLSYFYVKKWFFLHVVGNFDDTEMNIDFFSYKKIDFI